MFVGLQQNVLISHSTTASISHQKTDHGQGHIEVGQRLCQRPCLILTRYRNQHSILDCSINHKIMDKFVRQYIYL